MVFNHVDPTEALVRMLITGPLSRDAANLQIFPRPGGSSYDDFCDGDRMKRIYDTLPEGTAALTSVLFFDEINRDSKGFVTGDGVIIVGGFYKRSVMYGNVYKVCLVCAPYCR